MLVLCITSLVITFHRRRQDAGRKNGKGKSKSKEKHRIRGAKEDIGTQTENPTQEKTAESGRNGTKQVKRKTVLCRVESELLLSPLPWGTL